jgi:hypothetical protein
MEQVKFTAAEQGCLPPWVPNQLESGEIIGRQTGALAAALLTSWVAEPERELARF